MKPESLLIGVNQQEKYDVSGNYIRLSSASVPITFKTVNGDNVTLEQGGAARVSSFNYLLISHSDAAIQDIKFYIGDKNEIITEQKFSGISEIVGGANNLSNPPNVKSVINPLIPNTAQTMFNAVAGNVLVTLVAPASNINGVRIDAINIFRLLGSDTNVLIKTSAPTAYNDINASIIYKIYNGSILVIDKANFPLIIKAGYGLYVMGNTQTTDISILGEIL